MASSKVLKSTVTVPEQHVAHMDEANLVAGVIVGLLFLLGGGYLLYSNEFGAGAESKGLQKAISSIITADADDLDPRNDGKLIHVTGKLHSADTVEDTVFGVKGNDSVALKRVVTRYQWKELRHSEGSGRYTRTVYEYIKVWSHHDMHSERFEKPGHDNPVTDRFKNRQWVAPQVMLGAYEIRLPEAKKMFKKLKWERMPLTSINTIPDGGTMTDKGLYYGKNGPDTTEIGDLRITHEVVPHGKTVTICALQNGDSLIPLNNERGAPLFVFKEGEHSYYDLLGENLKKSDDNLWTYRIIGGILLLIGLASITAGLSYR